MQVEQTYTSKRKVWNKLQMRYETFHREKGGQRSKDYTTFEEFLTELEGTTIDGCRLVRDFDTNQFRLEE